jgi:hypothetical protein
MSRPGLDSGVRLRGGRDAATQTRVQTFPVCGIVPSRFSPAVWKIRNLRMLGRSQRLLFLGADKKYIENHINISDIREKNDKSSCSETRLLFLKTIYKTIIYVNVLNNIINTNTLLSNTT